jgi:protein gp37
MSRETPIQWADSSLNLEMGCDGCELWNPAAGVVHCYAGAATGRRAGLSGWPKSFDQPERFPHRLTAALRWPDLTGIRRPGKPWLDGLPRLIFLNDMGDTFTESLPVDWLSPSLPEMAGSPHVWQLLTKRVRRMAEFWTRFAPVPANFWLMTSVTTATTLGRARDLMSIPTDGVRGLSVEPLLEPITLADVLRGGAIHWVMLGGESDQGKVAPARPCLLDWLRRLVGECRRFGVPVFLKQLGSHVLDRGTRVSLRDRHGGDWTEWPAELRVREMPRGTTLS